MCHPPFFDARDWAREAKELEGALSEARKKLKVEVAEMQREVEKERRENVQMKRRLESEWKGEYGRIMHSKRTLEDEFVARGKELQLHKERTAWCEHRIEVLEGQVTEWRNKERSELKREKERGEWLWRRVNELEREVCDYKKCNSEQGAIIQEYERKNNEQRNKGEKR